MRNKREAQSSKTTPIFLTADAEETMSLAIITESRGGRGRCEEDRTTRSHLSPFNFNLLQIIHR